MKNKFEYFNIFNIYQKKLPHKYDMIIFIYLIIKDLLNNNIYYIYSNLFISKSNSSNSEYSLLLIRFKISPLPQQYQYLLSYENVNALISLFS